jgi:phosphoglycolate phosphatase
VAESGWAPIAERDVRRMIGRGGQVLVERAAQSQQRTLDADTIAKLVERFFHHYGALEESHESVTEPYEGVMDALRRLRQAGLRSAVVTNKQHRFAEEVLRRLGLQPWIDLIVGGDSCERRKPDPQPLLYACEQLRLAPSRMLMVGDSINDVQAARAARTGVTRVTYGYNEGQDPRTLPCDAWIDSLTELPGLLLRPD